MALIIAPLGSSTIMPHPVPWPGEYEHPDYLELVREYKADNPDVDKLELEFDYHQWKQFFNQLCNEARQPIAQVDWIVYYDVRCYWDEIPF